MLLARKPSTESALEFVPELIEPAQAEELARLLFRRARQNQQPLFEGRNGLNYHLNNISLPRRPNSVPDEYITDLSSRVLAEVSGQELIAEVIRKALRHMSGLKRGGLEPGWVPGFLSLQMNAYAQGDIFPTHYDPSMTDVVTVTLYGKKGVFMHVTKDAELGTMPKSSSVLETWQLLPGQGMSIQNHPTSTSEIESPLHAVENGPGSNRLSLQVELFYCNPEREAREVYP